MVKSLPGFLNLCLDVCSPSQIWIRTGSVDCSDHLIWIRTGSGDCSDHLGWIRTGSGGFGDLGIRKKKTNISVDVDLLTMQQVHRVLWELFPVPVDLLNAA